MDFQAIKEVATPHYKTLYLDNGPRDPVDEDYMLEHVSKLIFEDMNSQLTVVPSVD